MSAPAPNYTDPSGTTYYFNASLSANSTVTPAGYHFKNVTATAQFVADVLWLTCFVGLTLAICWVRSGDRKKPNAERASYKYLRWPVMGISTICMVLIYTILVYNRIVHEIRKPIRWYYPAAIGVGVSTFNGFATGLLMAFLLWQFTPILLLYGNASLKRTKWTILFCRFLLGLVSLLNTADTIVTAMLWVLTIQNAYSKFENQSPTSTENKITTISTINDAALTSVFTGMYLACVLIFSAVAALALKHLHTAPPCFKLYLSLLTTAIIVRSLLDFLWALVFKVGPLRQHMKLQENLSTNLIHTLLYGFFSVVAYGAIICIARLPLPEGVDHSKVNYKYLPQKAKSWHQRLSFHGAATHFAVTAPAPVQEELWKGAANVATVEEGMRQRSGGYADDGDPRFAYAGNADSGAVNARRYGDGIAYQQPIMQARY